VLLSSGELFRRTDLRRIPRRRLAKVIDSFLELREGDLVVHVSHGIARYRGLKLLDKNGQVEEHLELEFEGRTKLYVPSSKIGLVQKYVGGTKGRHGLPSWAGGFGTAERAVHSRSPIWPPNARFAGRPKFPLGHYFPMTPNGNAN
jgi:transcription-repair coupling factor (superfamily II helicase)